MTIEIGVKVLEMFAIDGKIWGSGDGNFMELLKVNWLFRVHPFLDLVVGQVRVDVSNYGGEKGVSLSECES